MSTGTGTEGLPPADSHDYVASGPEDYKPEAENPAEIGAGVGVEAVKRDLEAQRPPATVTPDVTSTTTEEIIPPSEETSTSHPFLLGLVGLGSLAISPLWFAGSILFAIPYKMFHRHKEESRWESFQSGVGFAMIPVLKAFSMFEEAAGKHYNMGEMAPTVALDPSDFESKKPRLAVELKNEANALRKEAQKLESNLFKLDTKMSRDDYNAKLGEIHQVYTEANEKYERAHKLYPTDKDITKAWTVSLIQENATPKTKGMQNAKSEGTKTFITNNSLDKDSKYQEAAHLKTIRLAEFLSSCPRTSNEEENILKELDAGIIHYNNSARNSSLHKDIFDAQVRACEALILSNKIIEQKYLSSKHSEDLPAFEQIKENEAEIERLLGQIKKTRNWHDEAPRLRRLHNARLEQTLDQDLQELNSALPKEAMLHPNQVNIIGKSIFYKGAGDAKVTFLKQELTTKVSEYSAILESNPRLTPVQRFKLRSMITILHHLLALDTNMKASTDPQQSTSIDYLNRNTTALLRGLHEIPALKKYETYILSLNKMVNNILSTHPPEG